MLAELSIRDLALIEGAGLEFGPGLNVVTGETGAGKTLLVSALELLLGERPRGSLVRKGAARARVDGRFVLRRAELPTSLVEWLSEHHPEALEEVGEDLELVLSRTLESAGRTAAHLDGRPVTRRALRELAAMLVEIHGQNDHQRLLDPIEQTRLLDAFGGLGSRLASYREARTAWHTLLDRRELLLRSAAERLDRIDLLRFQTAELDAASPSLEEALELRRERERLRHAEELGTMLGGLVDGLIEGEGAALDTLRHAERTLEAWERRVEELHAPSDELREAVVRLEEAGDGLRRVLDRVEVSPQRLEEVEARLAELERLERKYRVDLAGLCELLPKLAAELAELEDAERGGDALLAEVSNARASLEKEAAALTRARRKLRAPLVKAMRSALTELGLERAEVEVVIEPRAPAPIDGPNADADRAAHEADVRRFGADGADRVEFLLAANPGEEPGPLRAVASGGEAARVMLALRGALAARQSIPTLVFDEVDAGVGGKLAPRVGRHLASLAEHYQILCVTHLPAVAARAHRHLRVQKHVEDGRTRTRVQELSPEDRIGEVADMIAGGAAEETARAEARRLLGERG